MPVEHMVDTNRMPTGMALQPFDGLPFGEWEVLIYKKNLNNETLHPDDKVSLMYDTLRGTAREHLRS